MLTDERFSDPEWIFERKPDGIRCIAVRDGDVRLMSRPPLGYRDRHRAGRAGGALRRRRRGRARRPTISRSRAPRAGSVPIFYYAFDVLWIEDRTCARAACTRKLLRATLRSTTWCARPRTAMPTARRTSRRRAARVGGRTAKRADSRYRRAAQDRLCSRHGQELVISGFTEPRGTRIELGALLLGVYEGGALRYAGKVGTGFDRATLKDLGARLRRLQREDSPFAGEVRERGATWVEPELVAQIGFAEWTRDGRLRHPRYLGLRDDKAAREVVRERPT
jgi:ATP-dependent DNA ligase